LVDAYSAHYIAVRGRTWACQPIQDLDETSYASFIMDAHWSGGIFVHSFSAPTVLYTTDGYKCFLVINNGLHLIKSKV
jgi:hypothetical protein